MSKKAARVAEVRKHRKRSLETYVKQSMWCPLDLAKQSRIYFKYNRKKKNHEDRETLMLFKDYSDNVSALCPEDIRVQI